MFVYDVTFDDGSPPPAKRGQKNVIQKNPLKSEVYFAVMKQLSETFSRSQLNGIPLAFDGRNLIYTTRPLPFEEQLFELIFDDKSENKEIKFKISKSSMIIDYYNTYNNRYQSSICD